MRKSDGVQESCDCSFLLRFLWKITLFSRQCHRGKYIPPIQQINGVFCSFIALRARASAICNWCSEVVSWPSKSWRPWERDTHVRGVMIKQVEEESCRENQGLILKHRYCIHMDSSSGLTSLLETCQPRGFLYGLSCYCATCQVIVL